ncbi:hypothetical protein F4813DRAFT_394637 [Daldinia decipiens]|uniref:uncharacterized protein n=1 Tax=Daldinia decipiens TaxID=326647 RepID=UPI0020C3217B|nr:uncharacterized protein F4813DRAFT_394637 [Daldinia decipiens]KAI1652471.1 hypothetical protein F4813DRAFT_394637 [Daldinia decipiens]
MAVLSLITSAKLDTSLDVPALNPPNDITSNFGHPPNKNYISQAVIPTCLALTTIAVLLRTCHRLFCVKKIGFPDILMLISLGCYIVCAYLNYRLVEDPGAFVHQWDVLLKNMSDILFPLFLSGSFYIGAVLAIKAAILLDWIRSLIPYGVRNNFFWFCYGVLGANVIFYIVTLFLMNFACVPIEKNWNHLFVGGSCPVNRKALSISSAVLNLCSDISILLLPQHVIWRLDMSTKRRIGVCVIFAIGVLLTLYVILSFDTSEFGGRQNANIRKHYSCCASAGLRLRAILNYSRSDDIIYYTAPVMLWALAEMTCMFLIFGTPSAVKILPEIRFLDRFTSSPRSLGERLTRRSGSRAGIPSWPGSDMINNPQANSSYAYYRRINNFNRGVVLTTIGSQGNMRSDSIEHLKDHVVIQPPERGKIMRTTHFETHEEYGDFERDLALCDGYDRQHPWAKDRI